MKKLLAILLALVCVIGVFAGCSGSGNNETKPQQTDEQGKVKEVITIGLPVNVKVEDYETNALTLWIEEETGYDLTFQIYASSAADYKTQLATQLLDPSIKLPDMLWRFTSLGDSVWKQYGEEGYFINLTPYFEDKEKSKIWWERVAMFDETFISNVLDRCTADDGNIYCYPNIERGLIDSANSMAFINQKWLEKVGMKAPTNTDELYTVLKAFKDQICVDESYHAILSRTSRSAVEWILCLFSDTYNHSRYFGLTEDGKKITTPFTSDEYREGLKFLNKLVKEGIMSDGIFSITSTEVSSILNNESGSRVGILVGHCTIDFNDVNNPNLYDYVALDLYNHALRAEFGNTRNVFITEDAANPDACWEILMLLATDEGAYRVRYGIEGENWTWCKGEGKTSYMGLEAEINMLFDPFGMVGNENHKNASPTVNPNAEGETCYMGDLTEWMKARYALNGDAYNFWLKHEFDNPYIFPIIVLTDAETEENKSERSNCQNVISTYRTKFCKGTDGLDPNDNADWEEYLNELDEMGLDIWVAQYQRIYEERYMDKVLAGK